MGARHLCQALVEGTLKIRAGRPAVARPVADARRRRLRARHGRAQQRPRPRRLPDLSRHGPATRCGWPSRPTRPTASGTPRPRHGTAGAGAAAAAAGGAVPTAQTLPAMALHPQLHGEVRPPYDPRSTLYNTDGQIFSDAGVPVVLFMENYDINRARLSRQPGHAGQHRPRLRRGGGGHRHRVGGPGGDADGADNRKGSRGAAEAQRDAGYASAERTGLGPHFARRVIAL